MPPTIALLSDFTESDVGVGVMKGVIASICPAANVIDLCHEIPPIDIFRGALHLRNAVRWFPDGTIFVAVVDPDVGSGRTALVIEAGDLIFVGPDNGLLSLACEWLLREGKADTLNAYAIQNTALCLQDKTYTFDGRDVFAPIAAHLANGISPKDVGPRHDTWIHITVPDPASNDLWLHGRIISIDRFGNLMTNIERRHFEEQGWDPDHCRVMYLGVSNVTPRKVFEQTMKIVHSFSAIETGCPAAYFGSWDFMEEAINSKSAADVFNAQTGTSLLVLSPMYE